MKTIDKWLRRADNVMGKGRPSWDTLADALRRINENTSAQFITEQSIIQLIVNGLIAMFRNEIRCI